MFHCDYLDDLRYNKVNFDNKYIFAPEITRANMTHFLIDKNIEFSAYKEDYTNTLIIQTSGRVKLYFYEKKGTYNLFAFSRLYDVQSSREELPP